VEIIEAAGRYTTPGGTGADYVVTAGRGRFTAGGRTVDIAPGTTLFVPAHEVQFFHDITEDLALLVFFGPAEGSRL
jgi:mannose-6-phosphate isomerase-like protein (cupin superfamily)